MRNGSLYMENTKVLDNISVAGTGAFNHTGGELTIVDSEIKGNNAIENGSAISSNGSAILSLERVIISGNETTKSGTIAKSAGSLFVNDCTISDNVTAGTGGGMFISGTSFPEISVTNCTIEGNTSDSGGGVIITIRDPNTVFNFDRVTIKGNTAVKRGGGLYVSGGDMAYQFKNLLITDNKVTAGSGGAIDCATTTSTFINLLAYNNEVSASAGGIFGTTASITLVNASLINNKTTKAGDSGGIRISATGNLLIKNSIIAGNTSNGAEFNMYPVINASTTTHAGSFYNSLLGGVTADKLNAISSITDGKNLEGTGVDINNIFIDPDDENYKLLPWSNNPVINKGSNDVLLDELSKDLAGQSRFVGIIDLGAYEAQEIESPFEGTLNDDDEIEFTYSGSPIDLSLKQTIGSAANYSWVEKDNTGNTGSGLPTDAGVYTVNASITAGNYAGKSTSATVRVNKAPLVINFEEIPALNTGSSPYNLVATTIPLTSGNIQFDITEGSSVTLSTDVITPQLAGTTVIKASLIDETNYEYSPVSSSVFVQDADEQDATIQGILVNGTEAVLADGVYAVTIPFAATAEIEVIPNSTKAILEAGSDRGERPVTLGAENTFGGKVLAFSGSNYTEYILKVTVENNDASLSNVTVNSVPALETGGSYKVTIPYNDNAELLITPLDGNATVKGGTTRQLTNLLPGTNQRSISVTSQDKTETVTYPLEIYMQSNNAYLDVVNVDGVNATEAVTGSGIAYTITVAYTEKVTITATALHAAAVVTGQTGEKTVQEGSNNQFAIAVTAEDGTVMNYVLTVTVQEKERSNDSSISGIEVNGTTAVWDGTDYTAEVTTVNVNIEVKVNEVNATVSGAGQKSVPNGTTQIFTITVTAEDGTVNTFTLKVTNMRSSGGTDPETPTPSDYVTLTIQSDLPEGITIDPVPGSIQVRQGGNQTLTVTASNDYDGMYLFLGVDDEWILLEEGTLRSTVYTHELINIQKNMTIRIHVSETPDPNPTGNTAIDSNNRIWTAPGVVYIRTDKLDTVFIYSLQGKLVAEQRLPAGETAIPLPEGLYVVVMKNRAEKIIVRE